jgi:trimeric autotransporter adhesin
MATTISNGESGSSVRTKLNNIWEGLQINEIDSSIADTAVDIFVYDTSKDSDGGAWRKRTQHTSWYNETLNTSTRGSRKEFPAVAVIVKESGQVTIYDGDDPDLPMWMVFDGGRTASVATSHMIPSTAATAGGVSMLNGKLITGNNGDGASVDGLSVIDFLTEKALWYTRYSSATAYSLVGLQIAERNEDFTRVIQTGEDTIVNSFVNDVAMTVLPNAPIDAATGLPVPTIAAATDGGVSVIKDDGTVVDLGAAVSTHVTFDEEGNVFAVYDTGSPEAVYGFNVPSSDQAGYTPNTFQFNNQSWSGTYQWPTIKFRDNEGVLVRDNYVNMGTNDGLYKSIDTAIATTPSTNFQAKITSDYNTGWMNGDIKLATLSDTYDYTLDPLTLNNVTGSELVTNGTFDSDISSWSHTNVNSGSTLAWDSNGALLTIGANGAYSLLYQNITTVVGKVYTASVDYTVTSGSTNVRLGIYDSGGYTAVEQVNSGASTTGSGTLTVTFTASETTHHLRGQVIVNNSAVRFDNFSVRLAEEDRSVNGNGLQVFGTVTKDPVATGADLVAYSGFSASNYLEQPYNSDLDFGTGDFCYQFWEKHSQDLSNNTWLISWDRNAPSAWVLIGTVSIAGEMRFELASGNYTDVASPFDIWNCWHFVRRNGVCYVYLNGKQKASFASTENLNASARGAGLSVGKIDYTGSNDYWRGSVALIRISATAPSPEQIKKIYEDEKVLFQENAEATLYGSSDAVTALAYDDTTNILSVGTSDGRSDFQGLRRVNNTTTGVTTSISASNGLIVEQ